MLSARFLALAFSLLSLVACAGPTLPQGRIIDQPDLRARMDAAQANPQRQRRLALGGATLTTEAPLVPSPAIQAEAERIMARLLREPPIGMERMPRVLVVADRSYGAEVTRDGEIHVNLGVLARARTEDEIAFVLAHEAAHFLLGHGVNRDGSLRMNRGTVRLATGVATYGIVLGQGQRAAPSRGGATALVATLAAGQALVALAGEVADASYSRTQELEADRFGLDLVVRAGYQPGATGTVFNQLAARRAENEARAINLRGSVSGGAFIAAAQAVAPLVGGNEVARLGVTLGLAVAAFAAERAVGGALAGADGTHDSPEARREDLLRYEQAHHADVSDREASPNPFARGPLGREVAELMQALELIERAERAIETDDAMGAQLAFRGHDRLLDRRAPAQWRFTRARIAAMEGRDAEHARLLAEAVAHPSAYAQLFIEQAHFERMRGNPSGALLALQRGEERFGTAEPFLAHRVAILREVGNQQELQRALNACYALNVGAIERACSAAAMASSRQRG